MRISEGFWLGAVRRRDNIKALKEKAGQKKVEETAKKLFSSSSPSSMQGDLEKLNKKNEEHLKVPQVKFKSPLSKLSILGLIIAFILMAILFFVAGFMSCYSLFPPYHLPKVSIQQQASSPAVPFEGYAKSQAQRSAYLGKSEPTLLDQIEDRTLSESRRVNRDLIMSKALDINTQLRAVLGNSMGTALAPITITLAEALSGGVNDHSLTLKKSEPSLQEGQPHKRAVEPSKAQNVSSAASSKDHLVPEKMDSVKTEKGDVKEEKSPSSSAPAEGASPIKNVYAIEVLQTEESTKAYALQQDLTQRGIRAYVLLTSHEGRMRYAVRFGGFVHYNDSKQALQMFRSTWNLPARIVISEPNE